MEKPKWEKGVLTHIAETLIGKQGRKAAFGIWGFWVGNVLLARERIPADIWWHVFLTCALLIGCGTVIDRIVERAGEAFCAALAARAASALTPQPKSEAPAPADGNPV